MTVRAYWAHCRIQLREDMRYFWSDAFWNGALTAFFALLLILFYDAAGTTQFGGLTWPMLVWYIFAVQFSSGASSAFVRTVTLQVRSGEIVTRMSRPSNYALASFWEHVGTSIPSALALGLSILVSFLWLSVLLISTSLPFYLERSSRLTQNIRAVAVGFSSWPVNVYRPLVRMVLFITLLAFLGAYPADLVRTFTWQGFGLLLGAIIVGLTVSLVFFYRGLRRYESGNLVGMRG